MLRSIEKDSNATHLVTLTKDSNATLCINTTLVLNFYYHLKAPLVVFATKGPFLQPYQYYDLSFKDGMAIKFYFKIIKAD